MVRRIIIGLAVIALLSSASQAVVIRGMRGRRIIRYQYLVNQWKSDKLEVYEKYGFPVHRWREYGYGRVREHWKYYRLGKEFVFDSESNLVETHRFWPEDRRERFRRY
jgi:hypothetical protein